MLCDLVMYYPCLAAKQHMFVILKVCCEIVSTAFLAKCESN